MQYECEGSIFHSHVNYFPENLQAMVEEQGESFHQDIKTIEKIPRIPTCWQTIAGA